GGSAEGGISLPLAGIQGVPSMRFRAPPRCLLVGSLLLLIVAAGPLAAAAPPFALIDSRRAWLFNRRAIRAAGVERWGERGPSGKKPYRERHRPRDYVELYDPARKRFLRLYPWGLYAHVPAKKHYALVRPGRWAHPANRPLDDTLNADERDQLTTSERRTGFPRLGEQYEVLAPATKTYNCIAWSLGHTSSWVWPNPTGEPVTLQEFDALYGYYGFRRVVGLDYRRKPGVEKIVLYGSRRDDGSIQPTHAALQMADGTWSSKLGSL